MKRNSSLRRMYSVFSMLLLGSICWSQNAVTFGQQIAILKMIKPDLDAVGIMSTSLTEKEIGSMMRSSLQQGVKIFVAQPKDAREIPTFYKIMISEKKVQLILIPNADDKLLLDIGYEYLKENTMLDRIGVCVPDVKFLSNGAFFAIDKENGKLVAYVNQKVAVLVGAAIPAQENPSITFVAR
jgi:hypothetical protein